ncbi:unnamed protein product [Plutella xylostella]|uniref:(diamondback moth) hypothetical protein n=1 Tax=Plutella xylostella TaxID=51655 RepID=A0A8S4CXS9_PLUXY|nr:unnamed protein product [Plutella xylostella]
MALTVDKLTNENRFSGDSLIQFLLYLPFGLVLLAVRVVLVLVLWIASIILPKKSSFSHLLSVLACCTFGVYVKLKGKRDPRCSLLVANYVSALDSLACAHALGTISLRKWKVPPFFASSLGIRSAAQFVRKEHFADSPRPVLLQPEGGATNGRGLLQFCDWPFQIGGRVQPVAITVERPFTNVTVHRPLDSGLPWADVLWFLFTPVTVYQVTLLPVVERADAAEEAFVETVRGSIANALGSLARVTPGLSWAEVLWFLFTPVTVYQVTLLPVVERADAAEEAFVETVRGSIANALGVEATAYRWEHVWAGRRRRVDLRPLAEQVRQVLPRVPRADILRDLAITRSVDLTITNFLEGTTPYTPEPEVEPETPGPSAAPKYITPAPTGVFPKNAKDRQQSFQERKLQMIAAARQRYIEKHGLDVAGNC